MSWLAGAALAVAVLAVKGPRGRPVGRVATGGRRSSSRGGPGRGAPGGGAAGRGPAGGGVAGRGAVAGGPRGRLVDRVRGRPAAREPDLVLLVTDVASRLRAGADPRAAWQAALGRPVGPAGPEVEDLCRSADARPEAAAVVAAGRLAADLGAPLAPLLDAVAAQLAARAEAEGERRAALAGPRATAQVLTGLPALGVLLGVAVGADPLAVLLDGSFGSAALAAGVALVLLGRAWTGGLARSATAAGRAP